MLLSGDFVRITDGPRLGQTGVIRAIRLAEAEVRLSATGCTVRVPRVWLRAEEAAGVTVTTTEARQR